MDYKTKNGLFVFNFIYTKETTLSCRPAPPSSADHWIASPDSPDLPWLVPPSGLARPGKYPETLLTLPKTLHYSGRIDFVGELGFRAI